jgi:hypothetical protein
MCKICVSIAPKSSAAGQSPGPRRGAHSPHIYINRYQGVGAERVGKRRGGKRNTFHCRFALLVVRQLVGKNVYQEKSVTGTYRCYENP